MTCDVILRPIGYIPILFSLCCIIKHFRLSSIPNKISLIEKSQTGAEIWALNINETKLNATHADLG